MWGGRVCLLDKHSLQGPPPRTCGIKVGHPRRRPLGNNRSDSKLSCRAPCGPGTTSPPTGTKHKLISLQTTLNRQILSSSLYHIRGNRHRAVRKPEVSPPPPCAREPPASPERAPQPSSSPGSPMVMRSSLFLHGNPTCGCPWSRQRSVFVV